MDIFVRCGPAIYIRHECGITKYYDLKLHGAKVVTGYLSLPRSHWYDDICLACSIWPL